MDPNHCIQFGYRQIRRPNSDSLCVLIRHLRHSACALVSFWPPMIIPTGAISRLVVTSALLTGLYASGVAALPRHNLLMMLHARARGGVFPSLVRVQVTATACSLPQTQDVRLSRSLRAELARRVAAACPLATVSSSTVGRSLAAEKLKPWRYQI